MYLTLFYVEHCLHIADKMNDPVLSAKDGRLIDNVCAMSIYLYIFYY
jgi:hypothetical protein